MSDAKRLSVEVLRKDPTAEPEVSIVEDPVGKLRWQRDYAPLESKCNALEAENTELKSRMTNLQLEGHLVVREGGGLVVISVKAHGNNGTRAFSSLCRIEATAQRLSIGSNGNRSNGNIVEVPIFELPEKLSKTGYFKGHRWVYGPTLLEQTSTADQQKQNVIDAGRKAEAKARAAGLSDDDINALRAGK